MNEDNYKSTKEMMNSASKNRLVHEEKGGVELPLLDEVRNLIITARRTAAQNINILQVITNFEIGRLIIENEQSGKINAEYGKIPIFSFQKV
ncbi:hypothetical protein [Methanoplanus limicola]|uniref:hypothetical protein n=1 Tax=Methanoplanus limicola TaxID=2315 RepID=UPI001C255183|nr:hypothetical protein [Methanoplanus limicola]